jgi:hypothetical protein
MRFLSNIFLSDPSIFINDMWNKEDNADFAMALVRNLLPGGGKVIFEESRHVSSETGVRVQKEIYDVLIVLSMDNIARVSLLVLSIIGVMVYLRYVRLPTDWHHRDRLNEPFLRNYEEPYLSSDDNLRIRRILEEQIRVSLKLSRSEFDTNRKKILKRALKDPELFKFMTTWRVYEREKLSDVLDRISALGRLDDIDGGVDD